MRKKSGITEEEKRLFHKLVYQYRPDQVPENDVSSEESHTKGTIPHHFIFDEAGYFFSEGLSQRRLRQLKRGELKLCTSVDLHGHTLAEAETMMLEQLEIARQKGWRVLKIIHGKGSGALRDWLITWLPEQANIVAWQPAARTKGGAGVGYLLLKLAN